MQTLGAGSSSQSSYPLLNVAPAESTFRSVRAAYCRELLCAVKPIKTPAIVLSKQEHIKLHQVCRCIRWPSSQNQILWTFCIIIIIGFTINIIEHQVETKQGWVSRAKLSKRFLRRLFIFWITTWNFPSCNVMYHMVCVMWLTSCVMSCVMLCYVT